MLYRFKKYISYLLVRYIPGTSKLATMEAKRLAKHIFDNYDEHQRLIILEELKLEVIDLSENHIKNEEIKLTETEVNLRRLKANFDKLQELK
jgi:hypothetical protein